MITPVALLVAFQGRPEPDWLPVLDAPRNLTHVLQLPAPQHPGSKLEIRGTVLKRDGKSAAAGIVLYFHHTDARGVYPGRSAANPNDWTHWHGTLRGWLKTDAQGRYLLRTTRPAPYPGGAEPAQAEPSRPIFTFTAWRPDLARGSCSTTFCLTATG